MLNRLASICILTILLFPIELLAVQDAYTYKVRGRVVDKQGRPVVNAYVVIYGGPPAAQGSFSYVVTSDASGNFIFYEAEKSRQPETKRILYVTGPIPVGAVSLITPPFNSLPRLIGKSFSGQRIFIKKNSEINVGDVSVQINYGLIKVYLQDRRGTPLITDSEAWRRVWIRVRNIHGEIVIETSLSINDIEKAVNISDSSVTVALPEGAWSIEMSPDEDRGPWLASGRVLAVQASSNPIQITLNLPLKRKRR